MAAKSKLTITLTGEAGFIDLDQLADKIARLIGHDDRAHVKIVKRAKPDAGAKA